MSSVCFTDAIFRLETEVMLKWTKDVFNIYCVNVRLVLKSRRRNVFRKVCPIKQLTANIDFQFAEISVIRPRKLHDEVSVRRRDGGTPQVSRRDTGVVGNTGILRYTAGE